MNRSIIGVDLGSYNTKIYSSESKKIVFDQSTCVAVDPSTMQVKEIGYLANKIQGKTPYNFDVIYPIRNGIIYDESLTYQFLLKALSSIRLDKTFKSYTIIFSCPSECSKVNENVLISLGKSLQAKEIYLEPQCKLAALSSGENVFSPNANLICNIGAGYTDIAIISMGEIVSSTTSMIASTTFDEAIRRYMIQKQHLSIGIKTAEYIKMKIGDLSSVSENQLLDVKGRDTITSLPTSMVISSSEIKKVLSSLIDFLCLKITDVISSVDSELASDLIKNGLILTGGGALLGGLKDYFFKNLSLPVRIAKQCEDAVINGMKVLIDNIHFEDEKSKRRKA